MEPFQAKRKRYSISPAYMVFVWFGSFVMLGTILLWLPVSHRTHHLDMPFLSALFTAVSAACVTGLTVVNVHDTFSSFGQFVIFLLTEMGGMGIMTFASLGFRLLGRRLSLSQQLATADAIFQNDAANVFRRTFIEILRVTLLVQVTGAVIMFFCLIPRHWHNPDERWFMVWSAVFHACSAFCNSGFTLYQDALHSLRGNFPFLLCLLVLVTLGGLGHTVLHELYQLRRPDHREDRRVRRLTLHTKVVLSTTALLIVLGVGCLFLLGTGGEGSRGWQAFFETVSGRTAGFSLVEQGRLPLPTIIMMLFLMFVGGSPGSCAGGIKTTSLAIWFGRIKANLRNDTHVNMFGYTIAPDLVSRARILMAVTMIWNVVGVFILTICHPEENLQTLIFEQISAFGTVGLSMEFTPNLTAGAKLWVITSMFVGRLGPLSIALWAVPATRAAVSHPEGRIMVG